MKIAVASDHGGYNLKQQIISYLNSEGYEVVDCGTDSEKSCAYSRYGILCGELVASGRVTYGVAICTTGEGIMIAANKVKGVRCGLVYNTMTAEYIRRHNDCNMMAMGAKFTTFEQAKEYLTLFLNTPFEGGRHKERIEYFIHYENK